MKISVKKNNQVGGVVVSTSPTVGKLSLKTGVPGPQGPEGNVNAYGFIANTGGTMTGPLVIEFGGEGLLVNADAQIVNDLRVGEILRVGDFEITSNNFTTTSDGEITIDSFPSNLYSTVKYVIQVRNSTGIHATEIFCMQNGSVMYATEYATLISDAEKGYFSVELSGGTANLVFNLNNPSSSITNIHVLRHGLRF